MADKIIRCQACGKDIAQSAEKCPHCGAMTKSAAHGIIIAWAAAIIVFIILLVTFCR